MDAQETGSGQVEVAVCGVCKRRFDSEPEMQDHMLREHQDQQDQQVEGS